jgi:hypothetical protein
LLSSIVTMDLIRDKSEQCIIIMAVPAN